MQWAGLPSIKFNRWIPRAELVEKGFHKKVRVVNGGGMEEQGTGV